MVGQAAYLDQWVTTGSALEYLDFTDGQRHAHRQRSDPQWVSVVGIQAVLNLAGRLKRSGRRGIGGYHPIAGPVDHLATDGLDLSQENPFVGFLQSGVELIGKTPMGPGRLDEIGLKNGGENPLVR